MEVIVLGIRLPLRGPPFPLCVSSGQFKNRLIRNWINNSIRVYLLIYLLLVSTSYLSACLSVLLWYLRAIYYQVLSPLYKIKIIH